MACTFKSKSDHLVMPWKNGKGSTTELAIYPRDASVSEAFVWRISRARISTSGPFSKFPDMDRTILLLSGGPLTLHHSGHGLEIKTRNLELGGEAYSFSGDWETVGELEQSDAEDFNVICRRGVAKASKPKVIPVNFESPVTVQEGDFRFFLVLSGSVIISTQGQSYMLRQDDTLLVEGAEPVECRGEAGSTGKLLYLTIWLGADSRSPCRKPDIE